MTIRVKHYVTIPTARDLVNIHKTTARSCQFLCSREKIGFTPNPWPRARVARIDPIGRPRTDVDRSRLSPTDSDPGPGLRSRRAGPKGALIVLPAA